MVDFKFFLNRQGPQGIQGPQGEKGEKGDSITISQGTDTPTTYTLIFDKGNGNTFETDNLRYPLEDRGGTYVRWDGSTTQYLGDPDYADLDHNPGEVVLLNGSDFNTADLEVYGDYAVSGQFMLAFFNDLSDVFQDITDNLGNLSDNKADKATTYTKTEVDNSLALKADKSTTYTKTETNTLLNGKANTVHTHTLSQITDAGTLAGKNTVNYNTDITNKPTLGSLAAKNTVDYVTEVTNKPTIPTVGNGTITITQGGVSKGTFTTNQSGDSTIALDAGGGGGSTYTAGNGIDITSDVISAKVDGTTIGINSTTKEIELKASIPAAQIQSDWSQADNTKVDFIKNKPTIPDTTYMVTTNTNQTISGRKYFSDNLTEFNYGGINSNQSKTYFGLYSQGPIYKDTGYDITTPNKNNFLLEKNMLDGSTIQYNTTSGKVEVIGGGGGTPTYNFETSGALTIANNAMFNQPDFPGYAYVDEVNLTNSGEFIFQIEFASLGVNIKDQPYIYAFNDSVNTEYQIYLNGTSLAYWDGSSNHTISNGIPLTNLSNTIAEADRSKYTRIIHRLEISNNSLTFKYNYPELNNTFTTSGPYTIAGFTSNKLKTVEFLGDAWAGRSTKGTVFFENTFISDLNGNILWQPVSN